MKEKNRQIIEEEEIEESYLYFEIIGLGIILISIIILTTLGNIGYNLMLFFKLFFGDWYWLIIILTLLMGCFFLVKHQYIDHKTLRFNGIILIVSSLLILSHFPINEYLELTNDATVFGTWELYVAYLSHYSSDYIMGGGIIGGFLFQFIHFLLGDIGTKIITIVLLFVGLSFLFNLSIFDSLTLLKEKTFNFRKYLHNLKYNFRYYNKRKSSNNRDSQIKKQKTKKKDVSLKALNNLLTDYDYSMNKPLQKKVSVDLTNGINNILNVLNTEYIYEKTVVGASVTNISYNIITDFDLSLFKNKVQSLVDVDCLIKYDIANNHLECEINNKFRETLSLRRLLNCERRAYEIPIGETIAEVPLTLNFQKNRHLFISGSHNSGVKTFVKTLLISFYMTFQLHEFQLCFFDNQFHFEEFYQVKNLYGYNNQDFDVLLKRLTNEIEKRLELFNYISVNQIGEYNQKVNNHDVDFPTIEKIYFIINNFETIVNHRIENNIMYLAQVGEKCGIHLIIINRIPRVINSIINSVIPTKILLRVDDPVQSSEIIDYDYGTYLQNKGDFIYKYEDILIRAQSAYITNSEIEKITKKISL